MEDSEHRALWGSLGVSLLIAGVVVLSDWTFTAIAAPASRHLASLWWPWLGAVLLMIAGIWTVAAASNDEMWLPGKAKQRRRRAVRDNAEIVLATFHATATAWAYRETATQADYLAWLDAASNYVEEARGLHESIILLPPREDELAAEMFRIGMGMLGRLIERCSIIPVEDGFDPWKKPDPSWRTYLDSQAKK